MARFRHDTSLGGLGTYFPATQWTRILDTSARKAVLDELCVKYWKPLYSYLRCKGYSNEQAKDLVQGFFTEKVIDQELGKTADRSKGRFRNLLLVALRNYTINIQKREKHGSSTGLDSPGRKLQSDQDAEKVFNRAWAEQVLDRVLETLKQECERKGRKAHWDLFSISGRPIGELIQDEQTHLVTLRKCQRTQQAARNGCRFQRGKGRLHGSVLCRDSECVGIS